MDGSLGAVLAKAPQDLLIPNDRVLKEALQGLKTALDPIAQKYSVLDAVHLEGLEPEQVWTQAQMIVDGAVEKLFDVLSAQTEHGAEVSSDQSDESDSSERSETDSELDDSHDEGELNGNQFEEVSEADDLDIGISDASDGEPRQDGSGEISDDQYNSENSSAEDINDSGSETEPAQSSASAQLNNGLFELESFQQQVLELENDNQDNSDDEIDYFEDAGHSSSDEDLKFNDFFAPPKSKSKKFKKDHKNRVLEDNKSTEAGPPSSKKESLEQVMDSARKDLFDSEEEEDFEDGELQNLSKFERQQLELERQIREMEDENVADAFWAKKGEVQAKQRPQDSLINTELEFDKTSRPTPVITQEFTDSIEEMIRDRIKRLQFDDLPRRLPQAELKTRKELPEVQETKSQKSLAELYEEDQMRSQNQDYYKQKENEVMDAAHKAIVDMFSSLSRKLDALSSWSYTPKAPQAAISIVTNAASISMEDAQPATLSTASMLAPQEVFKPSADVDGEAMGSNNLPVARAEMTSEEKVRARRRAKNRKAKELAKKDERTRQSSATTNGKEPKSKDSKKSVLETLKKGNVSVIDKRGQKRDLAGNVVKDSSTTISSSHNKL